MTENHHTHVTDLEWLLAEVQRLDGCEATKARFMALLRGQVGRRIYFSHRCLVRPEQVAMAVRLLNEGVARPAVRDRLKAAHGLSTRHAYATISEALCMRDKARQASMAALQADMFRQHPAQDAHS